MSEYRQVDSLCVFFKGCEHTLVGMLPSQPVEAMEEWIDSAGSYEKRVVYDWQVFFSGGFEGEYEVVH
jgi:hypothetical protein